VFIFLDFAGLYMGYILYFTVDLKLKNIGPVVLDNYDLGSILDVRLEGCSPVCFRDNIITPIFQSESIHKEII